jgi:hypothetical protein
LRDESNLLTKAGDGGQFAKKALAVAPRRPWETGGIT